MNLKISKSEEHIEQNHIIPYKYIRRIALIFSMIAFVIMTIISIGFYIHLKDISIIIPLSAFIISIICVISIVIILRYNTRIGSTIILIGLQIFWMIYPYFAIDLPVTHTDLIWIISINHFIFIILSGLLIIEYFPFIISFLSIINIIIISILFGDSIFFIYKLPIILGGYLIFTFIPYYAISIGKKAQSKINKFSNSLKTNEEKYKALFEDSRDMMFIIKINEKGDFNNFLQVNKISIKKLNYTHDEFYNLSLKNILKRPDGSHFKSNIEFIEEINHNLKRDKYALFEALLTGKNLVKIPSEISLQYIEINKQSVALAVIRDISEKKHTENLILRIESDYKSLFDNMMNGFAYHKIILDNEGKAIDYLYIDVNEAYEKLFGMKRENLIGKRITNIFPKIHNQEHWIDYYENVALKGMEARFEVYYKELDKWLYVYAYSPKKMFFTVIIEDITENKKAKLSLIENEKKYRTLVEASIDSIFVEETDGTILDCNAAACSMYGFSKEEIIGRTAFDLSPDFVSEKLNYTLEDEVKNGGVTKETYAMKRNDVVFPIELRTRVVDISGKNLILAYVRDITEDKKNKEKLKESETKYRTLFNTSTSGIFLETLEGKIIDCNDTACNMLGYSKNELLKMSAYDLVSKEDLNELKLNLNDDLSKLEKGFLCECRNITKEGIYIPVQSLTRNIIISGKKYLLVYVTDITLRKKAMEELKNQKQQLDELFYNIQEGIQILDENEIIILCNPASEEIFEIEGGQLTGRCILDFLDEEGKKIVTHQKELRMQNIASTYEVPIITEKGNRRVIRIIATPRNNEFGEFKGVFAAFIDITYQKKVQEALEDSEEKYRTLVENSSDAIVLFQKGRILFHNISAKKLWGYSSIELREKTIDELMCSKKANLILKDDEIKDEIDATNNYEMKIMTKNNEELWTNISAVKTIWNNEPAILTFIRDITEQKLANQKIIEAKEKTEESMRLKNEFLANVSHELRTPLNSIMGFSQIMMLKNDITKDNRIDLSERIYKASKGLLSLIKDILDLSAMEHGRYIVNKELFNPLNLIKDIIQNYENIIIEKGLYIKIENEEYIPEKIYSDKQKISQIFNNLINNAVKFTQEGGITIKYDKDYDINDKIKFYVIDTGIGIPDEKRHLLFQAFTQVDGSITRNYGGTGLGLSITKNLVEILDGEIGMEKSNNKGSIFYFTIKISG